jgi:hypothetical protein
MSDMKKQAEELGIKVDGRWSEERLQSEIDKALAAPAKDPLDHDGDGKKGGAKPATLSVFLLYDTWIDDVRIRANPEEAVDLPRDRAKELLNVGKARRADPLPGDE